MVEITMLKAVIQKLVHNEDLSFDEAHDALDVIMHGEATEAQIGAFLVSLRMKGETPTEIGGLARAMRDNAVQIQTDQEDVVDTCGTGGDQAGTFNISTTAAFIAAGAGVPIAKHGNRSVSSQCGSADVLRELGVNIEASPQTVSECLNDIGIGFLYAPSLHPAMKYAIGPRRELGLRTVFNVLGPLTNPAGAKRQVLGVFSAQYTELLATALQALGSEHAVVVHGMVGIDEIATCGDTQVTELRGGAVHSALWSPEQFELPAATMQDIAGGPPEDCARHLNAVLNGEEGPYRDIAVFNAAAAIYVGAKASDVAEGIAMANESIDSGAAAAKLAALRELTRRR